MKLCYIDNGTAWFTSLELHEQWGDDWSDAPYEDNCGDPYEDQGELLRIKYEGMFETPAETHTGVRVSVQDMNRLRHPWLVVDAFHDAPPGKRKFLMAGASPEEFIEFIEEFDGKVWVEKE